MAERRAQRKKKIPGEEPLQQRAVALAARKMRSAISPRLAIRIFPNMAGDRLIDDEQRGSEFDGLAVLNQDRADDTVAIRLDLVDLFH